MPPLPLNNYVIGYVANSHKTLWLSHIKSWIEGGRVRDSIPESRPGLSQLLSTCWPYTPNGVSRKQRYGKYVALFFRYIPVGALKRHPSRMKLVGIENGIAEQPQNCIRYHTIRN